MMNTDGFIENFLCNLIDLTQAMNEIPSEMDFTFATLDDTFSKKAKEINQTVFSLTNEFSSYLSKIPQAEDQLGLEILTDKSFDSILGSVNMDEAANKIKEPVKIEASNVDIKEINGVKFYFSQTVPKQTKYTPKLAIPEKIPILTQEFYPDLEALSSINVDDSIAQFIDNPAKLKEVVADIKNNTCWIFITQEIHRVRTYRPFPCLISILAPNSGLYILDIMRLRFFIDPLKDLFEDSSIVKIFHDGNLIETLVETLGIFTAPVFDSSILSNSSADRAAASVGLPVERCVVDWRIRPLPPELIQIATNNIAILPQLVFKLAKDLPVSDVIVAMDQLSQISTSPYTFTAEDADKLALEIEDNLGELSPVGHSILSEILQWRDSVANLEDESPNFVIGNTAAYRLAAEIPENDQSLMDLMGRIIPPQVLSYRQDLLQLIISEKEKAEKGVSSTLGIIENIITKEK